MTISISYANAHRYVITIIDNDTWLSLARIAAVRAWHLGSSENQNTYIHRYLIRIRACVRVCETFHVYICTPSDFRVRECLRVHIKTENRKTLHFQISIFRRCRILRKYSRVSRFPAR